MGLYSATTEGERALTAASTKTMVEIIGATTVKARLVEFGISFDGTSSVQEPVLINLKQITATSTNAVAATAMKWDRSSPSAQCGVKVFHTAEPTKTSTPLASWEVHPQGGSLVVQYPLGREPIISDGSTGQGLCLEYVTASGVNPNCVAYVVWEE